MCHTLEMSKQVFLFFLKLCKHTKIRVENFTETESTKDSPHIIVSTVGKLIKKQKSKKKIDSSSIKLIVYDEADYFFGEERNIKDMHELDALIKHDKL